MALISRLAIVTVGAVVVLAAGLAYLRDPPWLDGMTSGLHDWTTDADGRRVRWAAGRASFFVPANVRLVRMPVRTTFDHPADWPIVVSVTIDDRPVERLTLRNPAWHVLELPMPARGSRRLRRIDIHLDRTRSEGRGILLGEAEFPP